MPPPDDPHGAVPVLQAGAPLERARLVLVMAHGRGAAADDMLALARHLALADAACLAPEAAGHSWWPDSFLAPLAANAPWAASGLAAVDRVVRSLTDQGIPRRRVALLGFSQGACLALEYAARSGEGLAAVVGLSGGLIGTADREGPPRDDLYGYPDKSFDYDTTLTGTAVFLGCHERDPHIPLARVRETAAVFERLGAPVTAQILPGAGHGVVESELGAVRSLLEAAAPPRR